MPRKKLGYKSVKGQHVRRTGPIKGMPGHTWEEFHELMEQQKQAKIAQKAQEKEDRRQRRLARGRPWHFAPKRGTHGKWIDFRDNPEPDRDPLKVNPDQKNFAKNIDLRRYPFFAREEKRIRNRRKK
jgi:hypothetical protein